MRSVKENGKTSNRRVRFAQFFMIVLLSGILWIPGASIAVQQQDFPERAIAHAAQLYKVPASQLMITNSAWLAGKIFRAKVFDKVSGDIYVVSLHRSGQSADEQEIEDLMRDEREKAFIGKIEASLKRKIDDDPFNTSSVVIWANPPELPREEWKASLAAGNREQVMSQARIMHSEAKSDVLDFLERSSIKVKYDSPITPAMALDVPNSLLSLIANLPQVARIYPLTHPQPLLNTSIKTIKAEKVWAAGFTGAGIKVAVVESTFPPPNFGSAISSNNPYLGPIAIAAYYAPSSPIYSNHAAYVAGVIASTHATYRGVSYGVSRPNDLLSGNAFDPGGAGLLATTDWAVANGANVINQSWGDHPDIICENTNASPKQCTNNDFPQPIEPKVCCWKPGLVNSIDADIFAIHDDYLVSNYQVAIVCANGNDFWKPTVSPAHGYNVIGVGSFDHQGTKSWSDDIFSGGNSYLNPKSPHNDREKPELTAPGHVYSTIELSPWVRTPSDGPALTGTSFAAPHVTGTAALLMQVKSSLKTRPDELKAVLMASAIHNIVGNTRLSNEDGAGGLEAYAAYQTVVNGRSGITSGPGDIKNCRGVSFNATAGQKVRFTICWLSSVNTATNQDTINDIDLSVRSPGGFTIATSTSFDNNFEIVEFTAPETGTYYAAGCFKGGGSPFFLPSFAWAYHLQ